MSLQKTLGIVSEGQGPESGVDPLPIHKGKLEPLVKLWNVAGAWPLSFSLMSTAFSLSLPITFFVPLSRFQRLFPAQLMGLCLYTTLSRVKVTRHPAYDPSRPSVYCMNHTSMLDAHVALHAIPQVFCGMMHAHHFKLPVYGWLMKRADGIGVSRAKPGQFNDLREQILERAGRGVSVLTFPEGRRTQNGRILPYRLGVFRMARDAGLPVVPLVARGMWQVLRRGEWIARPGNIEIYIGPQIETAGLSDDQLAVVAENLRDHAADYVERGILGDPLHLSRPAADDGQS